MAALLVAVPFHRVHQVPLSIAGVARQPPGFDVEQFSAEISLNLKYGLQNADLYGRASDVYQFPDHDLTLSRPLSPGQKTWLSDNEEALRLALEASVDPFCFFGDPFSEKDLPAAIHHGDALVSLIRASGHQLEQDGNLENASDRYLAALHVTAQLSPVTPWPKTQSSLRATFADLAAWGASPAQSSQQITDVISRLDLHDTDYLKTSEQLKVAYLIARRSILDGRGNSFLENDEELSNTTAARRGPKTFVDTLMPWEKRSRRSSAEPTDLLGDAEKRRCLSGIELTG